MTLRKTSLLLLASALAGCFDPGKPEGPAPAGEKVIAIEVLRVPGDARSGQRVGEASAKRQARATDLFRGAGAG